MMFNVENLNSILIKNKYNNSRFKYFLFKLKKLNNNNNIKYIFLTDRNILIVLMKQINKSQK